MPKRALGIEGKVAACGTGGRVTENIVGEFLEVLLREDACGYFSFLLLGALEA